MDNGMNIEINVHRTVLRARVHRLYEARNYLPQRIPHLDTLFETMFTFRPKGVEKTLTSTGFLLQQLLTQLNKNISDAHILNAVEYICEVLEKIVTQEEERKYRAWMTGQVERIREELLLILLVVTAIIVASIITVHKLG